MAGFVIFISLETEEQKSTLKISSIKERESRSGLLGHLLSSGLGRKWPAQPTAGCPAGASVHPHPPTAPSHQNPLCPPAASPVAEPRTQCLRGRNGCVFTERASTNSCVLWRLWAVTAVWSPWSQRVSWTHASWRVLAALRGASPLPFPAAEPSRQCYSSHWLVLARSQRAFLGVTTVKPKLH